MKIREQEALEDGLTVFLCSPCSRRVSVYGSVEVAVYQIKCFQIPACVAKAAVLGDQLFYNGKQLNKEVKATSAVVLEHWETTMIQGSGMLLHTPVPCSLHYFFSSYLYHIHFLICNFTSNTDKIMSSYSALIPSTVFATQVQNWSCFPQ